MKHISKLRLLFIIVSVFHVNICGHGFSEKTYVKVSEPDINFLIPLQIKQFLEK